MYLKHISALVPAFLILLITILACNLQSDITTAAPVAETSAVPVIEPAIASPIPVVNHIAIPGSPNQGKTTYDVESNSTALEKRAPYGDSWDINRLERPFLQDMTYVSDLDIHSFSVVGDDTWWYVSIDLIGSEPNNSLGINYGVEIDLDHDGFGDYLIWAHPPFSTSWDTAPVQIYQDKNHNTSGISATKCDAPITTDGYETKIYNGGVGDEDPDMAWVRTKAGANADVQFAFKKSWSGVVFMLGVISDAGLKDNQKLDYVDRFTEAEAGSPVRDKEYYPLGALFAVDNSCREAFGFKSNGYEPQICPKEPPPPREPGAPPPPEGPCQPPPGGCPPGLPWLPDQCKCDELI